MNDLGFAGKLADRLIDSPLVPLIILTALSLGAYGLFLTPREDRPDIEVPTAYLLIPFPGAGVERVDNLIARPVGAWLKGLREVIEVEAVSSADAAAFVVEFTTGTGDAEAYGLLRELLESNRSSFPPGVGDEAIEMIGDEYLVSLMVTLHSERADGFQLRRMGEELATRIEGLEGVRTVAVFGGSQRQIQVLPRPSELAALGLDPTVVFEAIRASAMRLPSGPLRGEKTLPVRVGILPGSVDDLARLQVGAGPAGVVYLKDVADIVDGPAPAESATLHWQAGAATSVPAVSLAVTTVPHRNVSHVTERALARIAEAGEELLPSDVGIRIAFDAGRLATETVRSVLENLFVAIAAVVFIITIGLGWRAAAGVSIMIPTILSVVPFAYYWMGFSLNPVSIAAMILAIGLIADDSVIIMENIGRHFRESRGAPRDLVVKAVDEVGNPTILAVILIVATLFPTALITGEMGQYTRAIPIGASLAILFSLIMALSVTPFLAYRLIQSPPESSEGSENAREKPDDKAGDASERTPDGGLAAAYGALLRSLFQYAGLRWALYATMIILLCGSVSMVLFRAVQMTLVPFLDREIFVIEMEFSPESNLEETLRGVAAVESHLRGYPEVEAYTVFAGLQGPRLLPPPGPPDIPPVRSHRASIYVQLPHKDERDRQSHAIGRDLFETLPEILRPHEGSAWIRRIPSGPSSENDIEAEIHGPDERARADLAATVSDSIGEHPAAGAIQVFPRPAHRQLHAEIDLVRASAHGVVPARAVLALEIALSGRVATTLDLPHERFPTPVVVRLAERERARLEHVSGLSVQNERGRPVQLSDVAEFSEIEAEPNRHRKNLSPVNYVGAMVNRAESQPISVQRDLSAHVTRKHGQEVNVSWGQRPHSADGLTLFWGGEWQMTRQVYRDLAIAGVAVVFVIYILLVGWFASYGIPLLIMAPIPLIFIGVIPAHWSFGLDIAGLGVLGVIALAGIVVRNAVLLVDFAQKRIGGGMEPGKALVLAGVLRTRPILLTAGTVVFGSGALILEPALQPLGLTLLSGVFVSTLLTLVLIPTLYFHLVAAPARPTE